jgi:hypothetical protein
MKSADSRAFPDSLVKLEMICMLILSSKPGDKLHSQDSGLT